MALETSRDTQTRLTEARRLLMHGARSYLKQGSDPLEASLNPGKKTEAGEGQTPFSDSF